MSCLNISDVELTYNRRSGYDVIFVLSGDLVTDDSGGTVTDNLGNQIGQIGLTFNPREGDYYTIVDDIATLHKVQTESEVTDDSGGFVTDDSGGGITTPPIAGQVQLTDPDGNLLFDADGNPLYNP